MSVFAFFMNRKYATPTVESLKRVTVIQLQGVLFYGNATILGAEVDKLLKAGNEHNATDSDSGKVVSEEEILNRALTFRTLDNDSEDNDSEDNDSEDEVESSDKKFKNVQQEPAGRRFIMLDFTLVNSIDASAISSIATIEHVTRSNDACLVVARAKTKGSSDIFSDDFKGLTPAKQKRK